MAYIAQRIRAAARIACMSTALAASSMAQAEPPPVATVNGVAIPAEMAEFYRIQGRANGLAPAPGQDEDLRRTLIEQALLFQAATQAGQAKRPEIADEVAHARKLLQAQMTATEQAIVTRAYVADYLARHPISDAQLRKRYDALRAEGGKTEYKLRHILVKTEPEARALIARLDGGARFDSVAGRTQEVATENAGGELGWSSPARFTPAFGAALKKLDKGAHSKAPVKTEFGYHVIQVDDTRPLATPSFDQLKNLLRQEAQRQQVQELVATLRAKAKIQ
ncbi:MAG: peptidylprolyl isomerase [Rhodocyclaceae bacterium]